MNLPISVGQPVQVLIHTTGRDITCQSEILAYAREAFVIRPPKRNGVSIPIDSNTLTLSISTPDAVFTLKCEIQSISRDEVILLIPLAENIHRMQRRQFLRMQTNLPAEAEPELAERKNRFGPFMPAVVQDISGGGCSLILTTKFDSDQVLRITFDLPLDGPLTLLGRVLRTSHTHSPSGGVAYATSIEFLDLSEAIRSKLIRFVFEIQRRSAQRKPGTAPLTPRGTAPLSEGGL